VALVMPLGFGWASAQTLRSTWHAKRFVNAPNPSELFYNFKATFPVAWA